MKIIKLLTVFIFLVALLQNSNSQNLFTDDFNYPVLDSLEGTGGWFRSGGNTQYNVKVDSTGLIYYGYPGSGVGNMVYLFNHSNGDIVLHNFPTQTSGSLYVALMFRVEYLGLAVTQGYNIALDQSGGSTNINTCLYIQKINSTSYRLGIAKESGNTISYESSGRSTGYTYLVVLKYTFLTGNNGNDVVKMYAFTQGVPQSEPANANSETSSGLDRIDIGQVVLSNSFNQTGLNQSIVKIDGIRIGTTWSTTLITGITPISNEIPKGFSLGQNYPNPFNPVTNINFSIPGSQNVKIVVMDILGKEVATLVNEILSAGTYKADFDASGLSSGIYFYRLETENYTEVKKMTLVK